MEFTQVRTYNFCPASMFPHEFIQNETPESPYATTLSSNKYSFYNCSGNSRCLMRFATCTQYSVRCSAPAHERCGREGDGYVFAQLPSRRATALERRTARSAIASPTASLLLELSDRGSESYTSTSTSIKSFSSDADSSNISSGAETENTSGSGPGSGHSQHSKERWSSCSSGSRHGPWCGATCAQRLFSPTDYDLIDPNVLFVQNKLQFIDSVQV